VSRGAAGLGAAAIGLIAVGAAQPGSLGTPAGVYTDAQAAAGAQVYGERCVMCHGAMLEGTYEIPALRGKFAANWSRKPVGALYDYIGRAMPQFAPGTLPPEENASVVAYLLKANGMPAGSRTLPANSAALQRITFVPVPAK
jgi:mono/diheme cytochrome c family protein